MCLNSIRFYSNYMAIVSRDDEGSCIIFEDGKHVVIFRVDVTGTDNPVILHEAHYTQDIRTRFAETLVSLLTYAADDRYFQTETEPEAVRNKYVDDETHDKIVESVRYNISVLIEAGMI